MESTILTFLIFIPVAGAIFMLPFAKLYGKEILKNPEKYFTKELMHDLNLAAETEFKYGSREQEAEAYGLMVEKKE